jgi:hypothetical protein
VLGLRNREKTLFEIYSTSNLFLEIPKRGIQLPLSLATNIGLREILN